MEIPVHRVRFLLHPFFMRLILLPALWLAAAGFASAKPKPIAVAPEEKDVEIGPGETDAGGERDGAAVNEVGAVAVNKIRKTR